MHISTDIWIWISAFLTLAIFSFLYKDNPFYRAAEHLFVGVSNGYFLTLTWFNVVQPMMIDPLSGAASEMAKNGISWKLFHPTADSTFFVIVPMLIGSLYIARFIPKISWMIRIPIAITMGYFSAISIPAYTQGEILKQVRASVLTRASFTDPWQGLWAVVIFLGCLATLFYFFFSFEHKGAFKPVTQFGILIIMIGFGASFGLTVMGRIALAIGRLIFLLKDWLGLVA